MTTKKISELVLLGTPIQNGDQVVAERVVGVGPVRIEFQMDISQDTTPQLGGNLSFNGHLIETVSATAFNYIANLTSNAQTQINGKSPLAGSSSLITTGVITTGTWHADVLGATYGGTGLSTYTQGDILFAITSNALTKLAKDTNATRYLSNQGTSNNPSWNQINLANGVTGNLSVNNWNSGIGASSTTYARGDGTWGTPTGAGTPTPTPLTLAQWDSNTNMSANNFIPAFLSISSNQTLTVTSPQVIYVSSGTNTVILPVTSTLTVGHTFIINSAGGATTVQSSGANNIVTLPAQTVGIFTCILASGTTASSWTKSLCPSQGFTGSGSMVLQSGPTLSLANLGTPASGTLTSCTGLPISTGVSGLGTGIATALAVNTGSAGAPALINGALGTPSSGTLTSCAGLPISSGVSGLGANVATMLATFSSANIATACSDETGSGALVFGTGPTLAQPIINGFTNNSTAAAGQVGEVQSTFVAAGSAVSLTSGVAANICQITNLPAGNWDVWAVVATNPAAGTTTSIVNCSVSTTSATLATFPGTIGSAGLGRCLQTVAVPAGGIFIAPIVSTPLYLNSATTVYLVANITFAASTCSGYGAIIARRRV